METVGGVRNPAVCGRRRGSLVSSTVTHGMPMNLNAFFLFASEMGVWKDMFFVCMVYIKTMV